jgi:hypothetical protein
MHVIPALILRFRGDERIVEHIPSARDPHKERGVQAAIAFDRRPL